MRDEQDVYQEPESLRKLVELDGLAQAERLDFSRPDPYGGLRDIDSIMLASYIVGCREASRAALEQADRATQVLLGRMEATGAMALDHPTLVVKMEVPSPRYDPSKLRRLYEVAPREEVDKAVTLAHDDMVHFPEKWNAVKFKTLLKYGVGVFEVLEAAKLPGGPLRLRISAKKGG